jgi:hypothetical protein
LHNSDIHDVLLDMDEIDLTIIEEWTSGKHAVHPIDQFQFRGISLDALLAKPSRVRREWLLHVQEAREAAAHYADFDNKNQPQQQPILDREASV